MAVHCSGWLGTGKARMECETQKTDLVMGQYGRDEPELEEKEAEVEESHLTWATHLLCPSFKCRERQLLLTLIPGTACQSAVSRSLSLRSIGLGAPSGPLGLILMSKPGENQYCLIWMPSVFPSSAAP